MSEVNTNHVVLTDVSDPRGTPERINPFDALFETRLTLVTGPSGAGNTVAVNALLERAIEHTRPAALHAPAQHASTGARRVS